MKHFEILSLNLGIRQPEDETPGKYRYDLGNTGMLWEVPVWFGDRYALGSNSMIWGPVCSGQYRYCPNHTRNVQSKQVLPRCFILQTIRLLWWPLVQPFHWWGGDRRASSIIPPIWAEKLQFPFHLRLTPSPWFFLVLCAILKLSLLLYFFRNNC